MQSCGNASPRSSTPAGRRACDTSCSAFGCGAFQNPSPIVAEVYKQEVLKRKEHFDVVAFAIFHAGYGPDNFGVFKDIIEGA